MLMIILEVYYICLFLLNDYLIYLNKLDFEKLFIRMLEKLNWYDLLYLLGAARIKKELTMERIEKIHNPSLRNNYTRLPKILHGETVPFTKWGPEFSEKVKDSLFSNRWYST